MGLENGNALLFGRCRTRSRWYLGASLGLFVGTLGVMGVVWVLGQLDLSVPVDGFWLVWSVAFVTVGVPAIQAYHNDGLLVSIALGLSLPLAFYLVLTTFDLVYPSEDLLWGVGTALLFGVPAGVLGFVVGAGARRLRDQLSTPSIGR